MLFRKNCYTCNRASFSSSEMGNWFCPTCGEDLTVQKAFDALSVERINMSHRLNEKSKVFYYLKKRT